MTRDVTEILNISKSSVKNYLKAFGYVSKLNVWVSQQLKEVNLVKRITICDSLLKRKENDPFFKRYNDITDDERWIVYSNIERKRSWGKRNKPVKRISKAKPHQRN